MYSNRMRLTGFSGMDTESMIKQLMKAESLKYDKLYRKSISLGWKQEAYRGIATKLSTFQTDFLSLTKAGGIRLESSFAKQSNSVKINGQDTNAVKIVSSDKAKNGTYAVEVLNLATKELVESQNSISISGKIEGSKPIDVSKLEPNSFYVSYNSSSRTISFSQDDIDQINGLSTTALKRQEYVKLLNDKLTTAFGKDGATQRVQAGLTSDGKLTLDAASSGSTLTVYQGTTRPQSAQAANSLYVVGATPEKHSLTFEMAGTTENISFQLLSGASAQDAVNAINNEIALTSLNGSISAKVVNGKIAFEKSISAGANTINVKNGTLPDGNGNNVATSTLSRLGFSSSSFDIKPQAVSQISTNAFVSPTSATTYDFSMTAGTETLNINFTAQSGAKVESVIAEINRQIQADADFKDKVVAKSIGGKVIFEKTGKAGNETIALADNNASDSLKKLGFGAVTTLSLNAQPVSIGSSSDFSVSVSPRTYNFNISLDGTSKQISFTTQDGWTARETIAAINQALTGQGLENDVVAKNNNGKIVFEKTATASEKTLKISNVAGPDLKNLGFAAGSNPITIEAKSMLTEIGLTDKMSTGAGQQTLDKIFGSALRTDSNGNFTVSINGVRITGNKSNTLKQFMDKVNKSDAGVTLSYDSQTSKFNLESNKTGSKSAITLANDAMTTNFGLTNIKTLGADATFLINGKEFNSETNTTEVDEIGMTLKLESVTNGEAIITVKKDVDSTFDIIKNFIDGYNEMIESLNKSTDEKRKKSKGKYFDPLTDEEKSAMKDKDIELWEAKAKEGLLYNDPIIEKITREMRTMLYQPVDLGDGKKISLYEIGITTGNYKDKGKLIIDEKKLKKALDERYEDVQTLFTKGSSIGFSNSPKNSGQLSQRLKEEGVAERVNDIIKTAIDQGGSIYEKAGIKGTSSELTCSMYKEIEKQAIELNNILSYLIDKENYYYQMFSRMESAMIKSDNQMSYLQAQMGM